MRCAAARARGARVGGAAADASASLVAMIGSAWNPDSAGGSGAGAAAPASCDGDGDADGDDASSDSGGGAGLVSARGGRRRAANWAVPVVIGECAACGRPPAPSVDATPADHIAAAVLHPEQAAYRAYSAALSAHTTVAELRARAAQGACSHCAACPRYCCFATQPPDAYIAAMELERRRRDAVRARATARRTAASSAMRSAAGEHSGAASTECELP